MLGKKQQITHTAFVQALRRIEVLFPRSQYEALKARTVARVRRLVRGKRVAYAWSGGKDSLALEVLMREAGVERCCFGMTNHLEYRAFLAWVTDHMPPGLEVFKNRWDLRWLANHPTMLFPENSTIASKWFAGIQRRAQRDFYDKHGLDLIITGNRRIDGNFCGYEGQDIYEVRGMVRFQPIADWPHEAVLAALRYEGLVPHLPPFYSWPRGFRCGTHAWPARQWCRSVQDGWREVFSIEPDRVREAAALIPSARVFLATRGE